MHMLAAYIYNDQFLNNSPHFKTWTKLTNVRFGPIYQANTNVTLLTFITLILHDIIFT